MEVGSSDDRVVRLISIGTPIDKYRDFDFLIGLTKPILFIHGDEDEFTTLESVNELVAEVSKTTDATLIEYTNCGHFFDNHLNDLRDAVCEWTKEQINKS